MRPLCYGNCEFFNEKCKKCPYLKECWFRTCIERRCTFLDVIEKYLNKHS